MRRGTEGHGGGERRGRGVGGGMRRRYETRVWRAILYQSDRGGKGISRDSFQRLMKV